MKELLAILNLIGIDYEKEVYPKYEFFRFRLSEEPFVVTYLKDLDISEVSTGNRVFNVRFNRATLSSDNRNINLFIGDDFVASMLIRS